MTVVKYKVIEDSIRARQDVERIVADYLDQDAERAGLHFAGTGSSRYEHVLQLPGLKFWRVPGYPHLVFYVEHPEQISVLRVLHGQRDIPASLTE